MNLKSIWRDTSRLALLFFLATLALWLDTWVPKLTSEPIVSPLLTSSAMVLYLAAFSHIARRVLFPRLDVQKFAEQATTPLAAAIVFFGLCLVVSVLIYANVGMLR